MKCATLLLLHAQPQLGLLLLALLELAIDIDSRIGRVHADGRRLLFRIWADDETDRIGEGTHERIIVNVARFDARAQEKAPKRA